jgi:VWFA-related protein
MRRTFSSCALFALVVALAQGQQPTFRAGVDLLRLDVAVVTAKDGVSVADLKPEDFEIEIDGYLRPIRSLQFVEYAAAPPAGTATGSGAFSENTGAPGRLTVIVVDEAGLAAGQEHAFIESFSNFVTPVAPQDRVALISLPGRTARLDFTNDAEALRNAALKLRAWSMPRPIHELIEINPVLDTLMEIAKSLKTVDGQKTLVFVSSRLPGGTGQLSSYRNFGIAAAEARLMVYPVRPFRTNVDMTTSERSNWVDPSLQGVHMLAGSAGGVVFDAIARGTGVFERIRRESEGRYVLGVEQNTTVEFILLAPDGTSRAATRVPPSKTGTGKRIVQAALPIGELDAGAYQVAARINSGAHSIGIVRRTVMITKGGA